MAENGDKGISIPRSYFIGALFALPSILVAAGIWIGTQMKTIDVLKDNQASSAVNDKERVKNAKEADDTRVAAQDKKDAERKADLEKALTDLHGSFDRSLNVLQMQFAEHVKAMMDESQKRTDGDAKATERLIRIEEQLNFLRNLPPTPLQTTPPPQANSSRR